MIETDAEGNVARVASASRADMWFFPSGQGEGQSRLHVRLQRAVSLSPGQPAAKYQFDEKAEGDIPVPAFSRDRTKFRTFGELRELLSVPEGMDRVAMPKRELAMQLAERQALSMIGESLSSRGRVTMLDEGGREVVVRGSRLEWVKDGWAVLAAKGGETVDVEMTREGASGGARRLVLRARSARLGVSVAPSGTRGGVELDLTLERVRTFAVGDAEVGGERASLPVTGLALAGLDEESFVSRGCEDLLAEAERRAEDPGLAAAGAKLRAEIVRLRHDVRAKQQERWAMAASCLAMVLTGAVTAVRLSRSQPLTVYLWTFFPALGCLVTISGGQQTMRDGSMLGAVILWAGVLALLVYALVVYRRLARH